MTRLAILLVIAFSTSVLLADPPQPEAPTVAKAAEAFPQSWIGHWKGDAKGIGGDGGEQRFAMELIIAPTSSQDRFTWTIVYDGAAGRSERPYELLVRDAAKGEYAIDEKNGIVLASRYFDGGLYSHFLVAGTRLVTRERLEGAGTADERITVEIITSLDDQSVTTGGENGAPEILSWSPRSIQTATLRRVRDELKAVADTPSSLPAWRKLTTAPYPGKQDDIYFLRPDLGWYVNGAGKIFKTTDGGTTWVEKLHKPGTFFRCIAFLDEKLGFAGNIGPGYFPNVTDPVPLYRTEDGGDTWSPVTTIDGPPIVGLCAMEVLREQFVNAGNLDTRTRIVATGRVGGPTCLILSDDRGATWKQMDISKVAAMAFDVHFFDRDHGVLAAASDTDVTRSNALILTTNDGGITWVEAYRSTRPFELTWKIAFPTREVGYVTVQSYNPDPAVTQRVVAKTTDGGKTWKEIPLVNDAKVREFGVAFLDANTGWVGATPSGFQTVDGGATWTRVAMGNAVNKIRVLETPTGHVGYAIGTEVHRIDVPKSP